MALQRSTMGVCEIDLLTVGIVNMCMRVLCDTVSNFKTIMVSTHKGKMYVSYIYADANINSIE